MAIEKTKLERKKKALPPPFGQIQIWWHFKAQDKKEFMYNKKKEINMHLLAWKSQSARKELNRW